MQDNIAKLSDGRIIGFSDYGKSGAIPIMLFHGTPGSRIYGLEDNPMLDQFGIRIITPERPVYGLSTPNPRRRILNWAEDVKELADHLGLNQFHVAGESGGGPYVLACATQMPTRVLTATLIGSACPPEVLRLTKGMAFGNRIGFFLAKHMAFLLKVVTSRFAKAVQKHPDKVMKRFMSQLSDWDRKVIETEERKRDFFVLHIKEAFRQGGNGHFVDSLLVSRPWGYNFNEIVVPVFMWHGEKDTLMPIAPAKEFAKLLSNCESYFLPDAGHLLLESDEVGSQILSRLLSITS
jgi:pimeloyl-ACP methyl ester carboxylesterase